MKDSKENKYKWENIYPNEKCDFEMNYKKIIHQIGHLKNTLQQLVSSYKALEDNKK